MPLLPRPLSPERLPAAAENAYLKLFRGGVADMTPWPSTVVNEAPHCKVSRYEMHPGEEPVQRTPVLLVPPLAAPPSCFDLYRGCSLAEHLTALGYRTYFVDYGRISFDDRDLGLEHWINSVIPRACGVTLTDSGADRVQLISWSLGGHHVAARRRRRPDRGRVGDDGREPVRLHPGADDGPGPAPRRADRRPHRHGALSRARRGA